MRNLPLMIDESKITELVDLVLPMPAANRLALLDGLTRLHLTPAAWRRALPLANGLLTGLEDSTVDVLVRVPVQSIRDSLRARTRVHGSVLGRRVALALAAQHDPAVVPRLKREFEAAPTADVAAALAYVLQPDQGVDAEDLRAGLAADDEMTRFWTALAMARVGQRDLPQPDFEPLEQVWDAFVRPPGFLAQQHAQLFERRPPLFNGDPAWAAAQIARVHPLPTAAHDFILKLKDNDFDGWTPRDADLIEDSGALRAFVAGLTGEFDVYGNAILTPAVIAAVPSPGMQANKEAAALATLDALLWHDGHLAIDDETRRLLGALDASTAATVIEQAFERLAAQSVAAAPGEAPPSAFGNELLRLAVELPADIPLSIGGILSNEHLASALPRRQISWVLGRAGAAEVVRQLTSILRKSPAEQQAVWLEWLRDIAVQIDAPAPIMGAFGGGEVQAPVIDLIDDASVAIGAPRSQPPTADELSASDAGTSERRTRSFDALASANSEPESSFDSSGQRHQWPRNEPSQQQQQPAKVPPTDEAPLPERYLNAGIQSYDDTEPLIVGDVYKLQFSVDVTKKGEASAPLSGYQGALFAGDDSSVDLTIQLSSDDFDIAPPKKPLTLPRSGPTAKPANFALVPKREGRCTLMAVVSKEGNYLLTMEMSYTVGGEVAVPSSTIVHGRSIDAATRMTPRDLGLVIKPVGNGYECTVIGATVGQVTLPISETELGDIVATARRAIMDVVTYADEQGVKVFQTSIDIATPSQAAALHTLALAGAEVFQRLFYGPLAGRDVHDLGDWLTARLTEPGRTLTLQIVAERFPVPWGLLYLGDTSSGAALDWNNFIGMRHVIDQLPRQASMLVNDPVIASDAPALSVSVTVNAGIDKQFELSVVADQLKYWSDRGAAPNGRVHVVQRQTKADLLGALRARAGDQLMYLYCHAVTAGPADAGGITASKLVLSNNESVTLADLNREAPMRQSLPGNPLVFLNACESAELTPAFYDGFVPYFMAKGARGVVGTECKTPALFATEWAKEFFPRFLGGDRLGELMLGLRREFCFKRGNPLGFIYAVYCDGDTRVQPGLPS